MSRTFRSSLALGLGLILYSISLLLAQDSVSNSAPNPSAQSQRPSAALATPSSATSPARSDAVASPAPPNPLGEAKALFRKGDFDGAIQKYQQILQENPTSPDAYAGLTRVYLKKKDVKQAHETATKGLGTADASVLRVAVGEVYFRQGEIHKAESEWVNVINSGHPDARAYFGLARVRAAISMYKSSRTLIEKAHQLDPQDPEIARMWAAKLNREDRIKYLEDYLAGPSNDDAETRASIQHYLEYLKARGKDRRGACHLVSKAQATEAPLVWLLLDPAHLRGFGLTVDINGEKSKLMLDTGASGIMINQKLAEKSGVTRLSDTDIGGIGDKGRQPGYVALASSLKVGDLEFQNCPVHVLDHRSVGGEEGLIGADVFSSFLVDLDFPNEKLHLRELPKRPDETEKKIALKTEEDDPEPGEQEPKDKESDAPPAKAASTANSGPQDRYIAPDMKSYTPVYRFGHMLLVPTMIGQTSPKLFLLDSGAFNNLISPAAAGEVTKVHGDSHTLVKGVAGSVKNVYRADKAVLEFGRLRQENQDLVAFDLTNISDKLGTEMSGILGFAMLRLLDVKIDYRDGLVDFDYDPKRWGN